MPAFVTWTAGKIGVLSKFVTPEIMGGKGYGLAQMCAKGYPVPPGFTITTEVCRAYWAKPEKVLDAIREDLSEAMGWLEDVMGYQPLVSVRSGAKVSMPGMMDTVLNVGLTSKNAGRWYKRLGGATYGDSRRRLLQMYGGIVLGVPKGEIDACIRRAVKAAKADDISQLNATKLLGLSQRLENLYVDFGKPMPNDPEEQILGAVRAVFDSWHSDRARHYRKINKIPDELGTAVNVQTMVFGNAGPDCGTGVLFTGNPATGEAGMVGEFMINAQGEDVVAGTHTPMTLIENELLGLGWEGMSPEHHEAFDAGLAFLWQVGLDLHESRGDMQDIEFTIEYGKLWLLQTRDAKRSGVAAINMVRTKYEKGELGAEAAAKAISFEQFAAAQRPVLDEQATVKLLGFHKGSGIGASVGAVVGRSALTLEHITAIKSQGHPAIYLAEETTPDDIACIIAADGIITSRGGFTSHAAVVARGLEKPCVVGCSDLEMTGALMVGHTMPALGGQGLPISTWMTLCASTGKVWLGKGVTLDAGAWVRTFVGTLAGAKGMRLRDEKPLSGAHHLVAAPAIAAGLLREWLGTLHKANVKDVIIDLRLPLEWVDGDAVDEAFLRLTGDVPAIQQTAIVDALCDYTGEGVKLYVPWLSTRADLVKRIEAAKYDLLPVAQTLAEAMEGGGKVVLGPALLQAIGSPTAQKAVVAMLASAGVEASEGLDSVTLGEAAASLLG